MSTLLSNKGGDGATSYASVEDADDYFELVFGAEEWIEIDDDTKERLLATATQMIERLTPVCDKADSAQALNFPCATNEYLGVEDDGFDNAKKACMMQAIFLFQNQDAISEARVNKIQGVTSETIGPTSKTMTGYNPLMKWAPGVLSLLAPYVELDQVVRRG